MAARAWVRIGLAAGGLLATLGSAEAVSFSFTEIAGDTLTDAEGAAFAAAGAGLDVFRYAGLNAPGFTAGQAAYLSVGGGTANLGNFPPGGSGRIDPAVYDGVAKIITPRDAVGKPGLWRAGAGWRDLAGQPGCQSQPGCQGQPGCQSQPG